MKRVQLEPWTAFDKHCLTSAVSRVGDQNWTAVSRATRNIYEDSIKWLPGGERRSMEWFSNKQCAAQYEHLLKSVPPRRKKRNERSPDQAVESPGEVLQQSCRHEFVEELKRMLAEEQSQYLKLLREYEDILVGRLDHKLEEMQEEYEAKEREKEIKLKLKYKLGEKNMAEATPSSVEHDHKHPPPPDILTSPIKLEKEVGTEQPKTSVTTSPLLTSLLQSPSPLTRPSSATPTISLLLNSSPSIPSHESPTLSKLLESSTSTGTSTTTHVQPTGISCATNTPTSSTPSLLNPQATTSAHMSSASTSTNMSNASQVYVSTSTFGSVTPKLKREDQPVSNPPMATSSANQTVKNEPKPIEEVKLRPSVDDTFKEPETISSSCATNAVSVKEEEKKRSVSRKLDLESIPEPRTDDKTTVTQVIQTVEDMIDKVQFVVLEVPPSADNASQDNLSTQEAPDLSSTTNAESETTTVEDHSLDALELSSDAVELIVMGPDRPPCIEVNRDTDSTKDDESKEENIDEIPDIDEIQPSISASDVAQLENVASPTKPVETPEPVVVEEEDVKPLEIKDKTEIGTKMTIEEAEEDLAAMTREEEGQDEVEDNYDTVEIKEEPTASKASPKEDVVITDVIEKVKEEEEEAGDEKEKVEVVEAEKEEINDEIEVIPEIEIQKIVEPENEKTESESNSEEVEIKEEIAEGSDQNKCSPENVETIEESKTVINGELVDEKIEVEIVTEEEKEEITVEDAKSPSPEVIVSSPKETSPVQETPVQADVQPDKTDKTVEEATKDVKIPRTPEKQDENEPESELVEENKIEEPLVKQPIVEEPVKAPVEPIKAPIETAKVPVESVKTPVEPVKIPIESIKAPVESIKVPTEPIKVPVKETRVEIKTNVELNVREEPEKEKEVRPIKRESLRRSGKVTPPVTSALVIPASLEADKQHKDKRPHTPHVDNRDKETKEEVAPRSSKRKRTTNVSESSVPCSPSPSTVSNDDDKEYRAWKKAILLVYDRFAAHKYASVFLKPINENDAPGYFQIIKCPTDLTTIKRQIESGVIRNTVDFQKEMILMISNAIIYNKMDTLVHKMACEMLPDMKEAMETMVQALGSGVPLDQPDSRPVATARVSRASVSNKSQTPDDNLPQSSSNVNQLAKRKRSLAVNLEDSRAKKKRSDAT